MYLYFYIQLGLLIEFYKMVILNCYFCLHLMMYSIYKEVADKMNIPVEVVEFAYKSYWKFIRKTIQELPLKE